MSKIKIALFVRSYDLYAPNEYYKQFEKMWNEQYFDESECEDGAPKISIKTREHLANWLEENYKKDIDYKYLDKNHDCKDVVKNLRNEYSYNTNGNSETIKIVEIDTNKMWYIRDEMDDNGWMYESLEYYKLNKETNRLERDYDN